MKTLSDAWLDKAWNIAGELVALNNIPKHRLFGYIIAEHLTGAFSCAKRAADPDNEAATCATHCGDFARCITAPAPALAASAPSQADGRAEFDATKREVAQQADIALTELRAALASQADPVGLVVQQPDGTYTRKTKAQMRDDDLVVIDPTPEMIALADAPSQAGSCQASWETGFEVGLIETLTEARRNNGIAGDREIALRVLGYLRRNKVPDCWQPDAPPAGRTLTDVVNSMPITWELSWGSDDEEAPCNWRVHECSGSRNDREWKLIGEGPTPADAILAASSTTAGERE